MRSTICNWIVHLFCFSAILSISHATSESQTCSNTAECKKDTMAEKRPSVSELRALPADQQVAFLGGVYEHSQWVAEEYMAATASTEITTVTELHSAMKKIVQEASTERQLELLRNHPDLCAKIDQLAALTAASQEEQSKSGLASLTPEERERFGTMNDQYKARFEFPFILAVRNASKHTVLAALAGRVASGRSRMQEMGVALEQVHKIAWMRLLAQLDTSDAKGFLTCHVLDTANGIPAANMRITLHRFSSSNGNVEERELIGEFVTNSDGRLEGGPALKGGTEFIVGTYEWTFYAGDYFASQGTFVSGTPFLNVIPLRFGIDNPDDHYHVPLLVSPWSYSTYRGS